MVCNRIATLPGKACTIRPAALATVVSVEFAQRHCRPAYLFRNPESNYTNRQSIVAGGGLIV